jgi:hypothetical protein
VTVNPHEVVDVEDFCGDKLPGQRITLKSKKTYLVQGVHADVIATLEAARKDEEPPKEKLLRTACLHLSQKQLNLWISPNQHGWRDCADVAAAYTLIMQSGVPQDLRVE